MCMEDIKIGRKLSSEIKTITCPAGVTTPAVGPNVHRVRLVIGSGTGNVIRYGPSNMPVAAAAGLCNGNQFGPVILRIEDIGNIITQAWSIHSPGVQQEVSVVDVSLNAKDASEL